MTSNILLPTELDTAISPNPLRATITDVIKSGIEVPAARNVRPITCVRLIWMRRRNGKRQKIRLMEAFHHAQMVRSGGELTSGGMFAVSPATFAHHTIRYE